MTMYFSKSTGGFYDDAIHEPDQIPSDAVEISQADYDQLMSAQSSGKAIQSDPDGNPIAVEVAIVHDWPSMARAELYASDLVVLRCVENGIKVPADWVVYRSSLRAIVSGAACSALPSKPAYPAGT